METYKSTYGKLYVTAMIGILLLMIAAGALTIFYMDGILRIALTLFYLFVIAVIIWIFCGTSYTFEEDTLVCRSGPFCEKIPYKKLKRATKCKGYLFSLALSELRIELKYGRRDTDAVFISPVNEDEFLELLAEKCPSMEVYEA